jgi:hypothetical protein
MRESFRVFGVILTASGSVVLFIIFVTDFHMPFISLVGWICLVSGFALITLAAFLDKVAPPLQGPPCQGGLRWSPPPEE